VGIRKRIFGISNTRKPEDRGALKFSNGAIEIEWSRVPELHKPCGAIRLQGRGLPEGILALLKRFRVETKKCKVIIRGTWGQRYRFDLQAPRLPTIV